MAALCWLGSVSVVFRVLIRVRARLFFLAFLVSPFTFGWMVGILGDERRWGVVWRGGGLFGKSAGVLQ